MNRRYQEHRRALGSEAVITLIGPEGDPRLPAILGSIWRQIDDFERRFSRFLSDSELSRLNRSPGEKFSASPEMIALLTVARDFARASGGLYNPLILGELQRAGYRRSFSAPGAANIDPAIDMSRRVAAAADKIVIDENRVKIPENSALDLGGIGKGYLLDRLAVYLHEHGVRDFWLSLGGDFLADGGDPATPGGWIINVAAARGAAARGAAARGAAADGDATHNDQTAAVIRTNGGQRAVATSGVTRRRGINPGGAAWHHLIDPRSGRPAATDVLTATVIAATATAADIWAKCLVIGGSQSAAGFAAAHDIENAYLQLSEPEDRPGRAGHPDRPNHPGRPGRPDLLIGSLIRRSSS